MPSPSTEPELFFGDFVPGWELLLTREQKLKQPGRYTLERIKQDEERVSAIIQALGAGFSARDVCKALHVHHRVVAGILGQYSESIDALKKRCGQKMLRTGELCVDFFREELLAGNVTARDASIAAGIFSDKGLLFAGDPTVIVGTPQRAEMTLQALNDYIASLPAVVSADTESGDSPPEPQQSPGLAGLDTEQDTALAPVPAPGQGGGGCVTAAPARGPTDGAALEFSAKGEAKLSKNFSAEKGSSPVTP